MLAAVTIGVYMGWHTPELTTERTRLSGDAFWEIFVFLVNALLFVLVGLQLRGIVDALSGISTLTLIGYASLVCAMVILTRLVWVPIFTYVPRVLFRSVREHDPYPPWQAPVILSWAGIRGAVSLAAALAIPLTTHAGRSFPDRDLIIFLTFCVLLGTLVLQGLSLPLLIRILKIEPDNSDEADDAKARIRAAEAALARLDELIDEDWVRDDTAERLRGLYGFRRDRFSSRFDEESDGAIEEQSQAYQRLRRELLDAERAAVTQLGRDGTISGDVANRVRRDLDLEDARLDV